MLSRFLPTVFTDNGACGLQHHGALVILAEQQRQQMAELQVQDLQAALNLR